MKICIFDICGTLYNSNTTFDYLNYLLRNNTRYQLFERIRKLIIAKAINKLLRFCFNYDLIRVIALSFIKGYNKSLLMDVAGDFYDSVLIKKSNQRVQDLLKSRMDDDGCTVVIASATIDVVAKTIGKKIGCSNIISSELQYNNDKCTGYLKQDLLGKKQQFLSFETKDAEIFTDDFSDVKLISKCNKKNIITYNKTKKKWYKLTKKKKWDANFIEY